MATSPKEAVLAEKKGAPHGEKISANDLGPGGRARALLAAALPGQDERRRGVRSRYWRYEGERSS